MATFNFDELFDVDRLAAEISVVTLQEARERGFQGNVTIVHILTQDEGAPSYVKIYEKPVGISFPSANRLITLPGAKMECHELLESLKNSHQDTTAVGILSYHSFSIMTARHGLERHIEEWASKASGPDASPCEAQFRRTVRAWRIAPHLRRIADGWISTHIGKEEE
jgi:hypothetical protein